MKQIKKLIINSPYHEPQVHWHYDRERRIFEKREGRRSAGYVTATPRSKAFDDPGVFVPIELVEQIRPRVKDWREKNYPGVTGITRRLLRHWRDPEEREDRKFFFCQLEAIETLIWLTEAPQAETTGIAVPGDGGPFIRQCCKMATGTGKTVIMAMLIAWQVLNKTTNRQDTRFSQNILVVAPGLTVKSRLSVLHPADPENYYQEFNIVPQGLTDRLRRGRILVINWHKLAWEHEDKIAKKKSVDKRGALSDVAYTRLVLKELGLSRNIIVINDEAHHAWRVPAESKIKGVKKADIEESTIWVGGLDRIHRTRGILRCFDLSATPFAPSGKKAAEEALFTWIVSDFGLNDAIESGLVKTPRVVIRDDSKKTQELKSRLYHIYMDSDVKDDLNRRAKETEPLPDLVSNAYYLLGKDWLETKKKWQKAGHTVPPVLITVANRTETSSRIKFSFDHHQILIAELCDSEKTLQIDSRILSKAESADENVTLDLTPDEAGKIKLTRQQQAELLRLKVDTVGQAGKPGEMIQNIISVGMLSEGWDAKTVTHIMGLRAFSSQLLCEQVVGRGLRRTCYEVGADGLFEAEYVNIFGVPFTFLPHEGGEGLPPPPPTHKTAVEPLAEKAEFEIIWPNVIRIEHIYKPQLHLDHVEPIYLDPYESVTQAEMAAVVAGKPNPAALSEIDLKQIARRFRIQTIVFESSKRIFNMEKPDWKGSEALFLAQIIRIADDFINSAKLIVKDDLFSQDPLRYKVLILLNINKIVQHLWNGIRAENSAVILPVFDTENPLRSTGQMRTWHTGKPCEHTQKSHINHVVADSTWEATEAQRLDTSEYVNAWAKNDHLGFAVLYNYKSVIRKYHPDFLIKLRTGEHLILETKGQDSDSARTKRAFLQEWVKAVNNHGGFGIWHEAISYDPNDLTGILQHKASG
ncbi:DEAD/DEAH box helicase family protein [Desulfococcaceae bacterium HSG7]|nr:DEAD/DEAH box helicase family protein [Desulfococcaceae bacterium HSG7]